MDAVMYLKERTRMCGTDECSKCPAFARDGGCQLESEEIMSPNEAVDFVEKWSKEHPRKTYLSDFLEKYPKAPFDSNHYPLELCPYHLGYVIECDCKGDCYGCWNTPIED